jgi:hypothetical protein
VEQRRPLPPTTRPIVMPQVPSPAHSAPGPRSTDHRPRQPRPRQGSSQGPPSSPRTPQQQRGARRRRRGGGPPRKPN